MFKQCFIQLLFTLNKAIESRVRLKPIRFQINPIRTVPYVIVCGGKHHTGLHKESTKNHDSQDSSPSKEKDVFSADTNMSGNLKTFMGYVSNGSKTVKVLFYGTMGALIRSLLKTLRVV